MPIPTLREQFLAALETEAASAGLERVTHEQRRWADFALRWAADYLDADIEHLGRVVGLTLTSTDALTVRKMLGGDC